MRKCPKTFVPNLEESHLIYNQVRTCQVLRGSRLPVFLQPGRFSTFWIGLLSVTCFVSTYTRVATFLLDMERFRYLEHPVIFPSPCYLCVSLGFLMRLVVATPVSPTATSTATFTRRQETLRRALSSSCWSTSSAWPRSTWWDIPSLTWCLVAGRKWDKEAISGYAQYLSLVHGSSPASSPSQLWH